LLWFFLRKLRLEITSNSTSVLGVSPNCSRISTGIVTCPLDVILMVLISSKNFLTFSITYLILGVNSFFDSIAILLFHEIDFLHTYDEDVG
jgi:hypothetical protein